ncbi:hypothetical protein KL949_002433 [Ogataea haglerorum]|nr:hypothetical protein KL913_002922 [Ogataea haglerorum]KAG7719441.1 hypothetical protein KL949_002433 [Ogataea haglerorum]
MDKFEKTAKRASKACDFCRSKKIKCDGESFCKNCKNHNIECTYMYVSKKRSSRRRKSANMSDFSESESAISETNKLRHRNGVSKDLEGRLNKLESMVHALLNKLDPEKENIVESFVRESDSPENCKQDAEPVADSNANQADLEEIYFGPLTTFSLFSAKGLKWLDSLLPDDTPTKVLRRHIAMLVKAEHQRKPTQNYTMVNAAWDIFPPAEIIDYLLNTVEPFFQDFYPMRIAEIRHLFDKYLKYKSGLRSLNSLHPSEVLLMSSMMLHSCCIASELVRTMNFPCPMPLTHLQELERKLSESCLKLLLNHTVSHSNLLKLQALYLLVPIADICMDHHACALSNTLFARSALELGLHREESYLGGNQERRDQKIYLWWRAYVLDKEVCLKSGLPPILNDTDITTPPLPGFEEFWAMPYERLPDGRHKREIVRDKIVAKLTSLLDSNKQDLSFELYLTYDLAVISSRTYQELFSATSLVRKTRSQITNTIESLLHDLECWRMCFPKKIRPGETFLYLGAPTKANNVTDGIFLPFLVLNYNLKYYLLQIIISKTMLRLNWYSDHKHSHLSSNRNNQHASFESIGLNAIRQILQIAYKIDKKNQAYVYFATYYFMCAYVALIAEVLQNLNSPEVVEDVQLLFWVSKNYFAVGAVKSLPNHHKWQTMDKISRCLFYTVWCSVPNIQERSKLDVGDFLDEFFQMADEIKSKAKKDGSTSLKVPSLQSPSSYSRVSMERPTIDKTGADLQQRELLDQIWGSSSTSGKQTPNNSEDSLLDGLYYDEDFLIPNMFSLPNYLFDVNQNPLDASMNTLGL